MKRSFAAAAPPSMGAAISINFQPTGEGQLRRPAISCSFRAR
jgi:hypothetical protein